MAKQVITDVIVQFLCYSFSSDVGQSVLFTECGFSVDWKTKKEKALLEWVHKDEE